MGNERTGCTSTNSLPSSSTSTRRPAGLRWSEKPGSACMIMVGIRFRAYASVGISGTRSLNGAQSGLNIELADSQLRLGLVQSGVGTGNLEQFGVCAQFNNPAALKNDKAIGFPQRAQAV